MILPDLALLLPNRLTLRILWALLYPLVPSRCDGAFQDPKAKLSPRPWKSTSPLSGEEGLFRTSLTPEDESAGAYQSFGSDQVTHENGVTIARSFGNEMQIAPRQ
jgi:hypothetical protein